VAQHSTAEPLSYRSPGAAVPKLRIACSLCAWALFTVETIGATTTGILLATTSSSGDGWARLEAVIGFCAVFLYGGAIAYLLGFVIAFAGLRRGEVPLLARTGLVVNALGIFCVAAGWTWFWYKIWHNHPT
jgi:hypothetical protein